MDATTVDIEDVLAGEKIPVKISNIDQELVTLWQATAQAPAEEAKQAVTLVRVMNLITYAEGAERADRGDARIKRITGRHPCRSILLVCRGTELPPGTLDAWISTHCHLPSESGKQICSEQITIAAAEDAVGNMHALALRLLISDTPVFLWWTSDQPFDDSLLAHLAENIDRLIVDSAIFKEPLPSLLKMAGIGEPRKPGARRRATSDFNWTRLTAWREATAQFFDLPADRRYLPGINGLEIDYVATPPGHPHNPVQALLYAGWLASRLDWKFEGATQGDDGAVFDLQLRRDGNAVTVRIQPVEAVEGAPGGISEVRLLATRPGQGQFRLTRNAPAQYMTTSMSFGGVEPTERTMIYVEPDEAELLNQELEMLGHDVIYEEALQMAALFARGSAPSQRWSIVA